MPNINKFFIEKFLYPAWRISNGMKMNWEDLTTFFDYPADIRRIIYTTNTVEAYHRQVRRVIKNKSSFPSPEAARKLLYLATVDIHRKWTRPVMNWPQVLNQLVIRFEDRIDF